MTQFNKLIILYKRNMKKVAKLLLVFAMIFSAMFGQSVVAKTGNRNAETDPRSMVVDSQTNLDWEKSFGKDTHTTADAGRIWTNKSVWNSDAANSDKSITIKRSDPNNFLVGLSAISSNKEIVGEESLPVDVVFVLDLSTSMDNTRVTEMTNAVNTAIDQLLTGEKLNDNNRVGVVAYNSNVGTLLPLDTYKKGDSGRYLENETNKVLKTATDLKKSNGTTISNEFEQVQGTNIQSGIITGGKMLVDAKEKDVDGVKRIPILVLMSDGEANRTNSDYINASNGESAQYRYGYFFTELTGEYYKRKIAAAYGRNSLVYTLGLDVGADGDSAGRSCLDPSGIAETTKYGSINKDFINIFNKANEGEEYTLNSSKYPQTNPPKYTRIADDMKVDTNKYNDLYFNADTAKELGDAFNQIIQEIIIQSCYYPTDNDTVGGGQNLTGYVTFEDEIGPYMEVKKMNGLLFDNNFQSGTTFAMGATNNSDSTLKFFETDGETMTTIGNEFLKSIIDRVNGINASNAEKLVQSAISDGQIAYTDSSNYSNYIAWYGDANGNYLGFASKKDKQEDIPKDAVTLDHSYFYLSKMRVQDQDTSLMYISVRVEENLNDKTQKVIYKIPSSLVPLVMFNAKVSGDDMETATSGTLGIETAYPARLFYEVGLRDEINEFNVSKIVGNSYPYKDKAGKTYSFYSNAWVEGTQGKTTATFKPNEQNEYYYFVKNTTIYTDSKCETPLKTEPKEGKTYYYMKNVFSYDKFENTGKNPATTTVSHVGVQISEKTLFDYKDSNGNSTWDKDANGNYYIKIGTPKGSITYVEEAKKDPQTGTATDSIYPVLSDDGENVVVYHGNNGRLSLEQQSGIMIEKSFTETQANPNKDQYFDFTVQLGNTGNATSYPVTYFNPQGDRIDSDLTLDADKKLTLRLREGAKAYIVLPTDVTYKVIEDNSVPNYLLDHIEVNGDRSIEFAGTVAASVINEGVFYNRYEETIPLTINKVVNGYVPENAVFDFDIEVNGTKFGDTLHIGNGGSQTINVPKGQPITVTEKDALNYKTTITTANGTGSTTGKTWTLDDVNGYQTEETIRYTNTYDAGTVTTSVDAVKTLVGRDFMTNDSFEFEIIDPSNDNARVALGNLTGDSTNDPDVANGHSKKIEFEKLSFTKPGVYNYVIREVTPSDGNRLSGVSYAQERYELTITVSEKNNEKGLEVTNKVLKKIGEDNPTNNAKFINRYATEISETLQIQKVINNASGANVNYSDFEFTATGDDGKVINGNVGEKTGFVTFNIKLTTEGTHTFKIKETKGNKNAIDYDGKTITAKVNVVSTNIPDAPLRVESIRYYVGSTEVTTNPTLTNTVNGEASAPITLSGTKQLVGREIKDDDNFEFIITPSNENGVVSGASESFEFKKASDKKHEGTLSWKKTYDKVGTYYYVVSEKQGNAEGVKYDSTKYLIQVDVTHDLSDNQLDAEAKVIKVARNGGNFEDITNITIDGLDFTNNYTAAPTSIDIPVQKVINDNNFNRGWQEGDSFNFILEETDETFKTVKNLHSNINLTKDKQTGEFKVAVNKAGTYYYTIRENNDNLKPGFTENKQIYKIKITAKTNQETGLLEAEYALVDATGKIEFTNEYNASPTTADIVAKKVFENNTSYTGKSITDFKFILKDENGKKVDEASPNEKGFINFTTPELNTIGTYKYTIEEVEEKDGIVYDKTIQKVSVEVTDNHHGQLDAKATYQNGTENPVFTNKLVFDEPVSVNITGKKTLTGRNLKADEFTFKLTASDDKGKIVENAQSIEVKNDKDGKFKFDLKYQDVGTHYYVIEEVNDKKQGISYDDGKYLLEVKITNDKDDLSKLKETHKITRLNQSEEINSIQFENEFTPSNIPLNLNVSKTLTGREWLDNDKFTFELKETSKESEESKEFTISSKDQMINAFEGREFKKGHYTFELKEVKPDNADKHMTYDETIYTIDVNVKANDDGILEPTIKVTDQNDKLIKEGTDTVAVAFENNYKPKALTDKEIQLNLHKILEGRDWTDKDVFQFVLTNKSNGTDTLISVDSKNNTHVNVFDDMKFKEGTYEFELREMSTDAKNIEFDDTVYKITIEVRNSNKGYLEAKMVVTDNKDNTQTIDFAQTVEQTVEFTNIFVDVPEPPVFNDNISLILKKTIDGRDWTNTDVFSFNLTDISNNTSKLIQTDTQNRTVDVFADKKFEEGEYHYQLKEFIVDSQNLVYDKSIYDITISVVKDENNQLIASMTITDENGKMIKKTDTMKQIKGEIEFVNKYVRPATKTGDQTSIYPWILALLLSGIILMLVCLKVYKRKNR